MNRPETSTSTDLLAKWLSARVMPGSVNDAGTADMLTGLSETPWERLAMLREVLDHHPKLARLVEHLPVYDQLKLSVEAVRPTHLAYAFSKGLATVSRASSPSQCQPRFRHRFDPKAHR
jgi:hypothetical protein